MWQVASWRNQQPASIRNNLPRRVANIHIVFYPKTSVKADLSNKAESILDLLVDARILEDDNWYCVPELYLTFGGKDAENPRAEITIT